MIEDSVEKLVYLSQEKRIVKIPHIHYVALKSEKA